MSERIDQMLDKQKQLLGALIDLLLRYGADPCCTICITDHGEKPAVCQVNQPNNCVRITLEKLLEQVVPAESMAQLMKLRVECSDERISHVLRRNQQKRGACWTGKRSTVFGSLISSGRLYHSDGSSERDWQIRRCFVANGLKSGQD